MMSVNQMTIYHTIMEVFKILHNKSSEQINDKYRHLDRHSLRKNTNNYLTAVFFETGAMLTPTKSQNGTNCGSRGSFQSYLTHS